MIKDTDKTTFLAAVDTRITTNGSRQISGAILNNTLKQLAGYLIPTLHIGSNAPPQTNMIWADSTTTPYQIKFHNGNTWEAIVGGQTTTIANTGDILIPAGTLLTAVVFIPQGSTVNDLNFGTSTESDYFLGSEKVNQGKHLTLTINEFFPTATTLKVTLTGTVQVKYYTR